MHAAALAPAVGIPEILIPGRPGVFSAVGLVMSDIRHDFGRTKVLRGEGISGDTLGPLFDGLDREAHEALERDGVPAARRDLRRSADLRYVGQAYEVNVPVPGGPLDGEAAAEVVRRFHDLHRQLYAHQHPDKPVEFVSGRVAAIGSMSAPEPRRRTANGGGARLKETRSVYFDETGGYVDTAVYDRDSLSSGGEFEGPAIVEQTDSTTVVHPGQHVRVDELGNLLIAVGE